MGNPLITQLLVLRIYGHSTVFVGNEQTIHTYF
jgi:hypothetical protein